jgi:hypothetical protein
MKRFVSALALLVAVGVTAAAAANDIPRRPAPSPQASVFPIPRDPWRSWGDGQHDRRHRGRPQIESHVVTPGVWIPGQWVWNGAGWVWWPGHWVQH